MIDFRAERLTETNPDDVYRGIRPENPEIHALRRTACRTLREKKRCEPIGPAEQMA